MNARSTIAMETHARWYRSFYFRIGFSFVVFMVAVLAAQNLMLSYVLRQAPFMGRSPNNLAAIIAADLGSTLTQDPAVDLQGYLNREYGRLQPTYAVMRDGQIASNQAAPLAEELRRPVQAVLAGTDFKRTGTEPGLGGPPVVMAPIQVADELRGIVVLPPAPQPSPVAREMA